MSDNPLAEKIGDKKSSINNSRLYSHNEDTACVLFGILFTISLSFVQIAVESTFHDRLIYKRTTHFKCFFTFFREPALTAMIFLLIFTLRS